MPADSPSLYGVPRPSRLPKHEISSSTTLSFTSHLSSLLAQNRPTTSTSARARRSKGKEDIFTTHNRNTKKRAATDLSRDAISSGHQSYIGDVDSTMLHRSKRKMEEKARLYAAMKRGDCPPSGSNAGINDERAPLIDFDRKWAEDEAAGREPNYDTSSDSDQGTSSGEEQVEYEDEFGRLRKGSKADAARQARRLKASTYAAAELDSMTARPKAPSTLIYGDTVQTAAFNPDRPVAAQMEEIARKRDRSMTPPEEVHYDATKEVRSKGVGFYQFSADKEERKKEMEALSKEREQTERRAREREAKKETRKREIEERRKAIKDKKEEKMAKNFLDSLEGVLDRDRSEVGTTDGHQT